MKIVKKQVLESSENLIRSTTNKFWGLISIFASIDKSIKSIRSGETYQVSTRNVSDKLQDLFYFGDDVKKGSDNTIYLRLSKHWIDLFNELLLKERPNILDCAIFYFKNEEFDSLTADELVKMFVKSINLPVEITEVIFNLNYLNIEIELESFYGKQEFLKSFKEEKKISLDYKTFSFEPPFLILSHPSELKRAPFIQTLYSGSKIQEALLITDFNIDEYYFHNNNFKTTTIKSHIENKILKRIIFESFKYIVQKYGEDKVLAGNVLKDTQIEKREYKGLSLSNYFGFETLIGLFENEQTLENLKSSGTPRFLEEKITILGNENSYFTSQWNGVDNGRGLSLENFNNLLAHISENKLEIIKVDDVFKLVEKNISSNNIIYYGAPGTGKSFKVDKIIENLDSKFYERVTFHPEYDNSSFIGGYKPISVKARYEDENGEYFENEVHYKFVPQAFTNIYERAWQDLDNQYYLVIEEINRGNCAEIFGEIFQLLDRNSNYTVTPSKELYEYLVNEVFQDKQHPGIAKGLKLPSNLSILATMNTSDQSLFPMDSAFKRRWDWEYIPICYEDIPENESYKYNIIIDETHSFKWIHFIKNVNAIIKNNPNLGMDKCIGNYFIKSDSKEISLKEFINKAIFYLWNDVFKDEDSSDSIFEKGTSYEDFFPIETKGKDEILKVLKAINIDPTIV